MNHATYSYRGAMVMSLVIVAVTPRIRADEVPAGVADAVTIGQIDHIRGLVGADSDTLVALLVDEDQARLALKACREWYLANHAQCHLLRQAVVARQRDVRETVCRIRVGPNEPEQARTLAVQRETLAKAREAYVAFVRQGLGLRVDACLTPVQRERRLVLLVNDGLAMPYRALNLTDQQRRQLGHAHRNLRQTVRAARTQDQRQAAIEAFEAVRATILSPAQQSQLVEVQEDMATSSESVSRALASETLAPSTRE